MVTHSERRAWDEQRLEAFRTGDSMDALVVGGKALAAHHIDMLRYRTRRRLSINVVPARQADPPPEGSATLAGFGPRAYTVKDGNSFRAAAPKGGDIVHVMVQGPKATREVSVMILKTVLPKL